MFHGPRAPPTIITADNQQLQCEGCGRKGHTPDTCRSREHANWNFEHATINFADTATGQAVQREARGTHLTCLPPSGVVWDPISKQWEECQALQEDWHHKIERARAKLAGRPIPPRQLNLLTGLHDNLPATPRGLTPKVSLYT
jgi:hypothetical protein